MNNALSVSAKLNGQVQIFKDLKSVKHYYGELTHFIVAEQSKNRSSSLEQEFLKELSDFTKFWIDIMEEFEHAAESEVVAVIQTNKKIKEEYYEIVEKVTGFRPPPDKIFLNLLAIRKIAVQLKNTEAVQFLNFDYFKKRNLQVNEQWIKERKEWLLLKIKRFEEGLALHLKIIKNRLNEELWKLHNKRQRHFDRLSAKYMKCKNLVSEVNSKESFKLKKMKKFFMTRNDVPVMNYYQFFPDDAAVDTFSPEKEKAQKKVLDDLDAKPASQRTIEKAAKYKKPPPSV